jgi:MFS family permease
VKENVKQRSNWFYGWTIVAICTVTMTLGYGVRHSFGVFFPPILDEFGWSRGSTAVMLSIHLFVYGTVAPFAGALSDRWRAKRMILAGALVMAVATVSCGFASELWHFYVIFGIFTPIGLALVGSPIINPTITNWFYKFRGIAFSLAQMGGGLSFLYAIYAESMIAVFGWRKAYFALGFTLFVILVPMLFRFYVYHPREKRLEALSEQGGESDVARRAENIEEAFNWTLRQASRTYQLWLLVICQTLFWGVGCYMLLAHQVKFAQDMGYNAMFAASTFGFFGISMVIGQVSASVSDKIGREPTLVLGCVLAIASVLILTLIRDASNPWMLYAYAIGFGFGAGLQAPTLFVGASDLFSGRHFGAINGVILGGMGVGGAAGPWVGGYIHDLFGSYRYAFGLSMLCFGLSAIAFVIAAPRRKLAQPLTQPSQSG